MLNWVVVLDDFCAVVCHRIYRPRRGMCDGTREVRDSDDKNGENYDRLCRRSGVRGDITVKRVDLTIALSPGLLCESLNDGS